MHTLKITLTLLSFFFVLSINTNAIASFDILSENSDKEKIKIFDADNDKIFENLFEKMHETSIVEELPVIVVLKEKPDENNKNIIKTLLGQFIPTHEYKNYPFLAMSLNMGEILILAASDMIKHIEYDKVFTCAMDDASYWYGVENARDDFVLDGTGIVVAVIDSGIDGAHEDLDGDKIIGWKDLVNDLPDPYDDDGHGTAVSGVIAGDGDVTPGYKGVAGGAQLVGVKVFKKNIILPTSGQESVILAGIDWCIDNKDVLGIDIINFSGSSSGNSNGTDAMSIASNEAVDAGIVMVVSAGNDGSAKQNIGSPSAAEKVISVGAMSDGGEEGFHLAGFSSRGPTADGRIKPDIVAPGINIMCPKANSIDEYIEYNGTSFSSPFTAGTIALMLEADPDLTPAEIKSILEETAEDWGESGKDIDYGSGRLDAYEAIKMAGGYTGDNIDLPNYIAVDDNFHTQWIYRIYYPTDIWEFEVVSTDYAIAVTSTEESRNCFLSSLKGIAFKWPGSVYLRLFDPDGQEVANGGSTTGRHADLYFAPTEPGLYRLEIQWDQMTDLGSQNSNYMLEVSGGINETTGLISVQDQ